MTTPSLFGPRVPAPPRAGAYQALMFDPPWLERGGGQIKRGADRHYELMKTDAIAALPVWAWAAPNAHLYLWVTNNFLQDGLRVMKTWGFEYVTKIDWFKCGVDDLTPEDIERAVIRELGTYIGTDLTAIDVPQIARRVAATLAREQAAIADADDVAQVGLGQYFRGVTESCLFGVRGSLPYRIDDLTGKRAQGRTGFHATRGEHSAKPEPFRKVVERVSAGPYLEGFARRSAPGWDAWGLEAA